jgi:AraC family carnitine catabolism transcriptional activator
MPGFSMLGLMSAVEPLRVANRFGGELYGWRFLTADGEPAAASNGMRFVPDGGLYQERIDGPLFVCAGFEPEATLDDRLMGRIRRVAASGGIVGGIDTGSVILARSRLLDGHRATVHWESLAAFREAFPDVYFKRLIY